MGRKAKVKRTVKDFKKKAEAVKFTREEAKKDRSVLVRGRLREKIHAQKNFREMHLIRVSNEAWLKDFQDSIRIATDRKEKYLEHLGIILEMDHAKAKFNLEIFRFENDLRNEYNARRFLIKKYKMNDKDLEEVIFGRYKKEEKVLDESEDYEEDTNYMG